MHYGAITADIKRIIREPILIVLMLVPLLALLALKAVAVFGTPLLKQWIGFDLSDYFGYLTAMALMIAPCMLGAVSGFMMIDDRDESMIDLMAVTPMGYSGYLANRLLMPFVLSILYTFLGYGLLNIHAIGFGVLVFLALLAGMESLILGLLLFSLTDNKVKGLTYAKALDSLIMTGLADLLEIKWVSALASLLPFYWMTSLVVKPVSAAPILLALIVHLAWLGIAFLKARK